MAAPPIETPTPPLSQPHHALPAPFTNSDLEVLTQGAEALVYRTSFLSPNTACVLKYRPPKPYRHPTLDRRLTKARLLSEARSLVRVRKEGVKVPAVLGGDFEQGWLVLEYVEGRTVRRVLDEWVEAVGKSSDQDPRKVGDTRGTEGKRVAAGTQDREEEILDLMARIGKAVGMLHEVGVVHGDLTTSNLMLRPPSHASSTSAPGSPPQTSTDKGQSQLIGRLPPSTLREAAITASDSASPTQPQPCPSFNLQGDIVLIDFGLASHAVVQQQDEDRAVDLYVLERAFAATHPSAERLFQGVLRAYGESYKDGMRTLKRLSDVRLRGRKRSMLG